MTRMNTLLTPYDTGDLWAESVDTTQALLIADSQNSTRNEGG